MTVAPPVRWDTAELTHLRRARDLMERCYAEPLDVPAMARAARMSPSHFARRFRAAYGETPYGFLMTRRVERAMALLRRGDLSVTDVCMAVGATSLGSFSSRFTELVGRTPSAYRAAHRTDRGSGTVPAAAPPAGAIPGGAIPAGASAIPACVAREWLRPGLPGPDRAAPDRAGSEKPATRPRS